MDALKELFQQAPPSGVDVDAVVRSIGQELLHYARLITGNSESAEDALHDTLVSLLQQGSAIQSIQSPRAWLFTVIRRKAVVYRKRLPLQFAAHFADTVDGDPTQKLILAEALATLDAAQQEAVILHLWEGLTFEDISQILDVPRGTVLSRYHRAIERLRERLGGSTMRPSGSLCERSAS